MLRFPTAIRSLAIATSFSLAVALAPVAVAGPWDGVNVWETARVERVVDGDTIIVRDSVTNARSRIRVLGINSPEKDTKKPVSYTHLRAHET